MADVQTLFAIAKNDDTAPGSTDDWLGTIDPRPSPQAIALLLYGALRDIFRELPDVAGVLVRGTPAYQDALHRFDIACSSGADLGDVHTAGSAVFGVVHTTLAARFRVGEISTHKENTQETE